MRRFAVLVLLLAVAACGSTRAAMKSLSAGTCEARCAEEHEDSLYDENRCRDHCEPPKQ